MLRAEQLISSIRATYLACTAAAWRGYERELLIELVRTLDECAFAFTVAPNRAQLRRQDEARHLMLLGAASALRPLIEMLHDDPGGVPWGPAIPQLRALADQHLINCGHLAVIQRLTAMERYGLAKASFPSENRLVLEVNAGDDDAMERMAGAWLSSLARARLSGVATIMVAAKDQMATRIDHYAEVHDNWFIRYDPDEEAIAYHREVASIYSAGTAEADALPGTALIGGRTFSDWNQASITASGRILHHIACATWLKARSPTLELRNLLTVFARKDDIAAVWQQAGETKEWATRIIAGLTLGAETAAICERDHELPLPYYVDFGRDFVLLPVFGGLMNSVAGLTWHLRRAFRGDWDKAVDGREQIFRDDLRRLFPSSRYTIPNRGFRLRRTDGTELTDVDAVVLDHQAGRLALIQLKWPDIYGRSLAERNSRRINLLKANEWVNRVSEWMAARPANEISAALGLGPSGPAPPTLIVLSRHTTHFSGETRYNSRAHWISWPRLVHICQGSSQDIFGALGQSRRYFRPRKRRPSVFVHQLPGLTVEIHS